MTDEGRTPATNGRRLLLQALHVSSVCLAGTIAHRDPMTGDALPRTLGEVLASVRRTVGRGGRPLPADGLQELVEFVLKPLREVVERPRTQIERSHAMLAFHQIREVDAKCAEWVGRQPGRTVREKLAGRTSMLGVRRRFSAETNANVLVAKLIRGLLPRIDDRLRALRTGCFDDACPERLEVLRDCERLCVRALRAGEFGAIDHRRTVRPNNVLLGDRRYLKLWRGWRWLQRLDAGEDARLVDAQGLLVQATFSAICAAIDERLGGGFGERFVLVPTSSAGDLGIAGVQGLSHAESGFEWRPWRSLEFVTRGGDPQPVSFVEARIHPDAIEVSRHPAVGAAMIRASEQAKQLRIRIGIGRPEVPTSLDSESHANGAGEAWDAIRVEIDGEALPSARADLDTVAAISRQVVDRLLGEASPRLSATKAPLRRPSMHGVDSCSIDLFQSSPAVIAATEAIAPAFAPFAVGFDEKEAEGGSRTLRWMPGSTGRPTDPFRKGIDFVSMHHLLDRGEQLKIDEQQGVDVILRGLRSQIESARGTEGRLATGASAIVVPDSVDPLSQRMLRKLASVALGRCVHLPRSACLVLGWQMRHLPTAQGGLEPGDAVAVVDARSDGIAVAFLEAKHDRTLEREIPESRGVHWERRPPYVAADLDPRIASLMRAAGWRHALIDYATRVLECCQRCAGLDPLKLRQIAEMLVDAGIIEQVFSTGADAMLPLGESTGRAIRVGLDRPMAADVLRSHGQRLQEALKALFEDPQVGKLRISMKVTDRRWHLLLADLPSIGTVADAKSGVHKVLELQLSKAAGVGNVHVHASDGTLAACGAMECIRRASKRLPSVVDWLPPLSLEVIDGGYYREFTMIGEQRVPVLATEKEWPFRVSEILRLPAGVEKICFPLFEGSAMRQTREVTVSSDAFPLATPLDVAMEVRYQIGEEQPYRLEITPCDSGFSSPIRADIGLPTERRNLKPDYPPARGWSDPWIRKTIGWAGSRGIAWHHQLDQLRVVGDSIDGEQFKRRFVPILRELHSCARTVWGEGRLLADAPPDVGRTLRAAMPFDWLWALAGIGDEAARLLEDGIGDAQVRAKLRRWSRRILATMHAETAEQMLEGLLAEPESWENLEFFGLLAGDGGGAKSCCLDMLARWTNQALREGDSRDTTTRAVVSLGDACWRHPTFVGAVHRHDPSLVDRYFEKVPSLLDGFRQRAVKEPSRAIDRLLPQAIRAIGETLIAFLRLRALDQPPLVVAAGSPLLTRIGIRFAEVERSLHEISTTDSRGNTKPLLLRSYLQFEFSGGRRPEKTSELAYALRHFLHGESGTAIEIVGRSDDDAR